MLREQLEQVRTRIRQACQRCGRDPSSVTLVAVTKTVPAETVREAIALGVADLGENRVQEAQSKREALGELSRSVHWHLIGHLQRNKAKHAVEFFDIIHSVDSLDLVEELERQTSKRGRRLPSLVQVNVSGEATKSGCRPEEAGRVARAIQTAAHLTLAGFMAIPEAAEDPEAVRPAFRRLRDLRDEAANHLGVPVSSLKLSMGMSHDFEVAIEEGADVIRVGTAIFGART